MLLAAAWTLAIPAFGQSGESEQGEVSARAGVAWGGGTSSMGTQPAVAGSAGVAFSRYGMILLDVSFIPLGQHTIQGWPVRSSVNRSYLLDFGVDFHIRIPIKDRVAPYAIVGTGLLWDMVRQSTVTAAGSSIVNHYSQFNGALHTGGGVRYYIGELWGIRPEIKVIVSKQIYTNISCGVFYNLPAGWP